MERNNDTLLALIDAYDKHPILWNPNLLIFQKNYAV